MGADPAGGRAAADPAGWGSPRTVAGQLAAPSTLGPVTTLVVAQIGPVAPDLGNGRQAVPGDRDDLRQTGQQIGHPLRDQRVIVGDHRAGQGPAVIRS